MSDATASDVTPAAAPVAAPDASPAPAAAPAADPSAAVAPAAAPAPAAPTSLLTDDETTGDAKTDDTEDGKSKDDDGKDTAKQGAPEEYTEFTAPEGVTLDTEVVGEFKTLAKDLNLSQEQAQKLVDVGARMQQGNAKVFQESLQRTVDDAAKQWATEAKADKEIGGATHAETLAVAKQALKTFGTPELSQFLKESRLGSHPEVIRLLARAGKAISQDGFVNGRSTPAPKDAASRLYPTSTQ